MSEITVVFQGPLTSGGYVCEKDLISNICAVRAMGCPVVLSCWDTCLLSYDFKSFLEKHSVEVVQSSPKLGRIGKDIHGLELMNRNLQALSSFKGIKAVNTPFCLKARTDQIFDWQLLIDTLEKLKSNKTNQLSFGYLVETTPFLFCDFIAFGLTSKLMNFYKSILDHQHIIFLSSSHLSEIDYIVKYLFNLIDDDYKFCCFLNIKKFSNCKFYLKYPRVLSDFICENKDHFSLLPMNIWRGMHWRGIDSTKRMINPENKVFGEDYDMWSPPKHLFSDNNAYLPYFFDFPKYYAVTGCKGLRDFQSTVEARMRPLYVNVKKR